MAVKRNPDGDKSGGHELLDLRHLEAFQEVYRARDYTDAGHSLQTNRKGIRRMIDRLEKSFQCILFIEKDRGQLEPSPFADRLFNDLRFLNAAQQSLEQQVRAIRESGRTLRVGSSPSIFRTHLFRELFREIQSFDRIRATYVPVKAEDAAKALAAGVCDLHVGCWKGNVKRFVSHELGDVPFKLLMMNGVQPDTPPRPLHIALLDDHPADFLPQSKSGETTRTVPEQQWLRWLDHPEECPAGVHLLVPDLPHDPKRWTMGEPPATARQTIYMNFLRQHPYEFMASLGSGIRNRLKRK